MQYLRDFEKGGILETISELPLQSQPDLSSSVDQNQSKQLKAPTPDRDISCERAGEAVGICPAR